MVLIKLVQRLRLLLLVLLVLFQFVLHKIFLESIFIVTVRSSNIYFDFINIFIIFCHIVPVREYLYVFFVNLTLCSKRGSNYYCHIMYCMFTTLCENLCIIVTDCISLWVCIYWNFNIYGKCAENFLIFKNDF